MILEKNRILKILQCMTFHIRGNHTEFAFDHPPDVDSSNDRAVCHTNSQVMGSSPILALNVFLNWASLHNCITYSFSRNGFASVIQVTA